MAKAEITVRIADLPIVQAKFAELAELAAALRDQQRNLRRRAETTEHALASLRTRVQALADELATRYPDPPRPTPPQPTEPTTLRRGHP